jgi:uncharacterized membrane protein required for colicin V production
MNWIDIVILVVWAVSAYWGYADGFLKVVVPFFFMAIGLALASRIGDTVGKVFSVFTDNENAQAIGGVILIFVVAFVLGGMVTGISKKALGALPYFGMVDKFGGMIVGLMVGFLLLSGILTGIQKFPFRDLDKTVDESILGVFLADQFDVVIRGVGLIPGNWDEEFEKLNP